MKNILTAIILFISLVTNSAQNYYPRIDATYIENYDGDTFKCSYLKLTDKESKDFEKVIISVRLLNVDTYEISRRSQTDEENQKAKIAKKLVSKLLQKGLIEIYPLYKDRYGRYVCEVYPYRSLKSLGKILKENNLVSGKYENKKINKPRIFISKEVDEGAIKCSKYENGELKKPKPIYYKK